MNESITTKPPCSKALLDKMFEFEDALARLPQSIHHSEQDFATHEFADGLYIRAFNGIKGMIAVSKLHKTNHPYFVMVGDCSVLTDEGTVRIKAPYFGITKAGTKRILYFHEHTVWITVHATEETDLKKIEDVVIAKNYNELPDEVKLALGIEEKEVKLCHGFG